ncbi:MAG: OadG family protein [Candidatus Krumholzibacteria bacterium]|jgi:sodium pump decarboxylase gamma subunit|nr:OadG family protein [Candidatus Krumholzibacteria bacterium]
MISDGLWLTVIGMSVVFVFLILLVAAIQAASLLLRKLPGDDSGAAPVSGNESAAPFSGGARATTPQGAEKIAAILASIADRTRKGS